MRSSSAFLVDADTLSAALLKEQVAQSRQRVGHELRLLLLRNAENDVYQALGNQRGKVGSVGAAGCDALLHHVDDRAVQTFLRVIMGRNGQFTCGYRAHLQSHPADAGQCTIH